MCDLVNLDYLSNHFKNLKGVKSVLEVGSKNVNGTCKDFIINNGLDYLGIDIQKGDGVDYIVDITDDIECIKNILNNKNFDLVICMNVLEHTYEPIKALKNMLTLLRNDGYLMVAVPLVWDLHEYPYDFYRLNPDFFRKFAKDNQVTIINDMFLLSTRDNRIFYNNVDNLPMIFSDKFKKGIKKILLKILGGKIIPGLYECWPHIYLNVTFQKRI